MEAKRGGHIILIVLLVVVVVLVMIVAGVVLVRPHDIIAGSATPVNYVQSEARYLEQISRDPQNPDPYRALARLYFRNHDYEQALTTYTQAINLAPYDAETYLRRGVAFAMLDQFESAATDYEQALSLDFSMQSAVAGELVALASRVNDDGLKAAYVSRAIQLAPTTQAYLVRGDLYASRGDTISAAADYERAVSLGDVPSDFAGHFYRLGESLVEAGQPQNALTFLNRAVQLNPQDANTYYIRARAYDALGDAVSATADYERAAERNDTLRPSILFDLGVMAYESGDYARAVNTLTRAVNTLTRAIDADSSHNAARRYRILSYHALGDSTRALAEFQTLLDGATVENYGEMAGLADALGRPQQALDLYNRMLEELPDDVAAYRAIGDLYLRYGDAQTALNTFIQVARLAPDDPQTYRDLGRAYLDAGDYVQAQVAYEQVLALTTPTADDYAHLGAAAFYRENYVQAVNFYTQAVNLDLLATQHRRALAWAYAYSGSTGMAWEQYEVVLALRPDDLSAYRDFAQMQETFGDARGALNTLERALDIAPDDVGNYDAIGQLHTRMGRYPQAIAYFSRALEISPDNVDILSHRAEAYFSSGDLDRAISDYVTAYNTGRTDVGTRLAGLYRLRADGYDNVGNRAQAIDDIERTLALNPSDEDAFWTLAGWRYERGLNAYINGDPNTAIIDFERLVGMNIADTIDPNIREMLAGAYFARAGYWVEQGQMYLAIDDYLLAAQHPVYTPEALLYLGDLYYRTGQANRSLEMYRTYATTMR